MFGCSFACAVSITCTQGGDDGGMLFYNDINAMRVGIRRSTKQKQRVVERTRRFEQKPVSARKIEAAVKILVDRGGAGGVCPLCRDLGVEILQRERPSRAPTSSSRSRSPGRNTPCRMACITAS